MWVTTLDVVLWAAIWLLGWGANSTWSLVGGYRYLAQAVAYELPLMFALTAPAVAAGSLRLADVVAGQHSHWYVLEMPVAFAVFLLGAAGFSLSGPLASPAGTDIAGGVLGELSGPDRLVLASGRWALLGAGAVLAVPLYLGGGSGPVLPAPIWTLSKAAVVLVGLVALRRRLPVLRPEQFMTAGWVLLLPLTLGQLLVTALLVASR